MRLRVIVENGHLRLLEPMNLVEGEILDIILAPIQTDEKDDFTEKLAKAGMLAEIVDDFEEIELSDTEFERLSKLFASSRSVLDDVNYERGDY